MAHKTKINGTSYEISGGTTKVGGTKYSISKGRTKVGGTNYDISFKKPLSEFSVGESVYLNVNGVSKEFLIIHKGLPSSLYDSSCNGIWLLMKDVYENRAWDSTDSVYNNSDIHAYLNGTFLGLFDSDIRSSIKQVKIPYVYKASYTTTADDVYSGASGMSTKIFLLSAYEIGWTNSMDSSIPKDGACLSYFSGTSVTDSKRIAYLNKAATIWSLRSPLVGMLDYVLHVSKKGGTSFYQCTNSYGVRPALILPNDTLV